MKSKLTQYELGYLAGIIEGEGCFEAYKEPEKNGLGLQVTIFSDSIQLIRWLKNKIGGRIIKDKHNKAFSWSVSKNDILDILKNLEPKLLFKRQQCNSMIRLMESLKEPKTGTLLTEQQKEYRNSVYTEHRSLVNEPHEINKKGKENQRVVLGLSGGADSTTMLYYLIWKGFKPEAVSVNYGQKHNKELEYAKKTCKKLKLKHDTIDLRNIANLITKSSLTSSMKVPEGHYEEENMKQTVVPARNTIFLSILSGIALSRNIPNIAYAAHASDSAIYPDCRPEYTYTMEEAIRLGNWGNISLLAPFLSLIKSDIIFLGTALDIPYENTWSCYVGQSRPCLKCGTDVERTESFAINNLQDPLLTDNEWKKAVDYLNLVNKRKHEKEETNQA